MAVPRHLPRALRRSATDCRPVGRRRQRNVRRLHIGGHRDPSRDPGGVRALPSVVCAGIRPRAPRTRPRRRHVLLSAAGGGHCRRRGRPARLPAADTCWCPRRRPCPPVGSRELATTSSAATLVRPQRCANARRRGPPRADTPARWPLLGLPARCRAVTRPPFVRGPGDPLACLGRPRAPSPYVHPPRCGRGLRFAPSPITVDSPGRPACFLAHPFDRRYGTCSALAIAFERVSSLPRRNCYTRVITFPPHVQPRGRDLP